MPKKYKYRKSFTFEGSRHVVRADSQAELYMKMANRMRDLEEGRVSITGNMTVKEWGTRAVEVYKTNQSAETQKKYIQRMQHCVFEEIGDIPLKKVTPIQCQEVLNKQQGKSDRHIAEVSQIIKFIFEKAKENKLILENPAAYIVRPIGYNRTNRSLTEQEEKAFIKATSNDKYMVFLLMYYCSCRPEEARECKGMDIEVKDGQPLLHIRGTKNRFSDRVVPIPDILFQRVKKVHRIEYLAPNRANNKHTRKSYERCWNSLKRDINIEMGCKVYRNQLVAPYPLANDITPYCLRHTYCTNLCKQGVDIRIAQKLMGHASTEMTSKIYTHVDLDLIIKTAKKLEISI